MASIPELRRKTGLNLEFIPSRAKLKPITHLTGKSQNKTVLIYISEYPKDFKKLSHWLKYLKKRGYDFTAYFTYTENRYLIAVRRIDSPCCLYIDIETKEPFISRRYRINSKISTFLRYTLYYTGYRLKYKRKNNITNQNI